MQLSAPRGYVKPNEVDERHAIQKRYLLSKALEYADDLLALLTRAIRWEKKLSDPMHQSRHKVA